MVWTLLLLGSAHVAAADTSLVQLNETALTQTPTVSLSHSGRYVAVQDSRAAIWLMNPAKHSRKLLCRSKRFLGRNELRVQWSPDDRKLLVTREGSLAVYAAPEGKQVPMNVTGRIALTEVSPNGRYLSFVREHNLWLLALDGSGLRVLTKNGNANRLIGEPDRLYALEFGIETHYWWAPDSSSIAFIETEFRNGDHYPLPGGVLPAFRLSVLSLISGKITTICESSDAYPYIFRVAWHPDSTQLAFYRMNRTQNEAQLTSWAQAGLRTILTERDAYWVNVPATPLFVSDGRNVVVTSERSGERRAYLYALHGELVRQLSPNGLEITRLFSAEDVRHGIYVTGVTGDKQNQQLYRLDFSGGEPAQVTQEAGWHQTEVGAVGDNYVDTFSTAAEPPAVWWHGLNSAEKLLGSSPAQPTIANEFIPIKTHDGVLLPARLFKPADFDSGKRYPLILYSFAGPRSRVVENSWDGWQMAWNRYLVSQGYLVLAVDPRGSGGYGHSFEEYIHYRLGAQETVDLREVVSWVRRQTYVDPNRLGIWGCDYGGHTVVHAIFEFPHGFKAAYADSPITDWEEYDAYFSERYLGLPRGSRVEYEGSSPLGSASRMTGQLLIAAAPENPMIRQDQVEALEKAVAKVKDRRFAKHLRVITEAKPNYRQDPEQLAALLASVVTFFKETLR